MVETNIKVRMEGKQYLQYLKQEEAKKEERNKKWSKFAIKYKVELILGGIIFILLFILLFTWPSLTPSTSIFERWAAISWPSLLKIGFCVVLISWLFHGVKVRLFA